MKDFLIYIAKNLVDNPEKVTVNEIESEKTVILELRVDQQDLGKVIGKHGRIAHSLRVLLCAIAAKAGKRVVLEIIE
ncbi:MAG: KH domain-containing protein [bacterium]